MKPDCLKIAEQLPDFLDGLCGPDDEARIRAHLETCTECREMADSLRLLDGAMEQSPVEEHLEPMRRAKIVETAHAAVVKARTGLFDRMLARFRTNTAPAPAALPWLPAVARLALFIVLPLAVTLVVTQSMPRRFAPAHLAGSLKEVDLELTSETAGRERPGARWEQEASGENAPAAPQTVTHESFFRRTSVRDAVSQPPPPPGDSPDRDGRGGVAAENNAFAFGIAKSEEAAGEKRGQRLMAEKKGEAAEVNFSLASAARLGDDDGVVMKGLYEGGTTVSGGSLVTDGRRDSSARYAYDNASAIAAGEPARPVVSSSPAASAPPPARLLGGVKLGWAEAADSAGQSGNGPVNGGQDLKAGNGRGLVRLNSGTLAANGTISGVTVTDGDGLANRRRTEERGREEAQVANTLARGSTASATAATPASDRLQIDASDRQSGDRGGFVAAGRNAYGGAVDQMPGKPVSKQKADVTSERLAKHLEKAREFDSARQDQSALELGADVGVANKGASGRWYAGSGGGAAAGGEVILEALKSASVKTSSGTLTLQSELQSDLKPAEIAEDKYLSELSAPQRSRSLAIVDGKGAKEGESEGDFSEANGRGGRGEALVKLQTELPRPTFVGTPVPLKVPKLEPAQPPAQVVTRDYDVPKAAMERFKKGDGYDDFSTYAASHGMRAPAGTTLFYDAETEKLQVTSEPETVGKLGRVVDELRASPTSAPALPDAPRPAPPRQPAPFNPYVEAKEDSFSTFGIDVDTASYTLTRRALLEQGNWPDPEHVRTEEIVNAFDYDYTPPANGAFSIDAQLAPSPFRAPLDLLKIGIRGRVIGRDAKKPAVLTVVLDTSGSMDTPDRLGRIRTALRLLADRLQPQDTIALVGFNDTPRLLLDRVNGTQKKAVLDAIDAIAASGSTQLEGGLRLGYQVAARGFVAGGANRVLLLSDGVANLGAATAEQILKSVEAQRKQGIYLTVLGFGSGNYDDAMLMQLADKGDGTYAFVDSDAEAQRLLVDDWEQTLHVIAKDAKIQVEFNPERVRRWRQLGYEKRQLTREQFRDDTVDAGEVGSGQSVTALYDVDLIRTADIPVRDPSTTIATVRVRYKDPDTGRVTELERRITNADRIADFAKAPPRFRVAACAAELAEKLRVSPYAGATELRTVADTLRPAAMELRLDQRVQELLRLAERAGSLAQ